MAYYSKSEMRRLKNFNKKCKGEDVLSASLLKDVCDFEEIVVPEGIKRIDFVAFKECTGVKKIVLPSTLVRIDYGAFFGLSNLEEVIMPDSVKYLGSNAFSNCKNLKRVKLSSSLSKLDSGVFYDCKSLKSITIPDGVTVIEDNAFYGCSLLERVCFNKNLNYIGTSAFEKCDSLKNIKFFDKLSEIGFFSFKGCTSLEKVTFSDNMVNIKESSFFGCSNLVVDNFISRYLFKSINLICKKKYNSLKEVFDENPDIRELINYISLCYNKSDNEFNILKFKNLLYKTRVKDMLSLNVFKHFTLEDTSNFDYKFWKKIENYVNFEEDASAFINFMGIFGLFKNDSDMDRRRVIFMRLISNLYREIAISSDDYYLIKDYLDYFDKVKKRQYVLKEDSFIPNEFNLYLDKYMSFNKVGKLKKINGTLGSHLNKFVKNNYDINDKVYYVLKDDLSDEVRSFICKHLYLAACDEQLNSDKINLLFGNVVSAYDKDFLDFFVNNLDLILVEITDSDTLSLIKESFSDIKRFYLNLGKDKINLFDCLKYLDTYKFSDALFGDERFISMFHNSGAPLKGFSFYREHYNKVKKKYKSSLPCSDIVFNYGDDKIRIRRLEASDPMQIFVGETNYTNCCLVYGDCAENCITGISESDSMGVTIVELLRGDDSILLTQSLDWTRNGVYCHDNIEGTEFLSSHKDLASAVFMAYKYQAKEILKKSKQMINKYLNSDCSLDDKKIALNQLIKAVVIGDNFNCIDLSSLDFVEDTLDGVYSEYICYSDSGNKRLLLGSVDEFSYDGLHNEDDLQIPFFKDERKVNVFDDVNITDEELLKMGLIEESSENSSFKTFNYGKDRSLHLDSFSLLCDRLKVDSTFCKVVLGEDFYIIYSCCDGDVCIHDLKRCSSRDKDESLRQLVEIKNSIYKIFDESLIFDRNKLVKRGNVTSFINKDNSYLLYSYATDLGLVNEEAISGDLISFKVSDKYVKKRFLK